jgi:hypothetical protein
MVLKTLILFPFWPLLQRILGNLVEPEAELGCADRYVPKHIAEFILNFIRISSLISPPYTVDVVCANGKFYLYPHGTRDCGEECHLHRLSAETRLFEGISASLGPAHTLPFFLATLLLDLTSGY